MRLNSLTLNTTIKDNNLCNRKPGTGRRLMNGTHKGHNIIVSVARRPATRQWEPRLTVIWSEEGKGKLNKLTVDRAFRARQEAEVEGLRFAKKWIDDGKPDLTIAAEISTANE